MARAKARLREMDLAAAELERMQARFNAMTAEERTSCTRSMTERLMNSSQSRTPIEERDQVDAMRTAMPDLERLARYERRHGHAAGVRCEISWTSRSRNSRPDRSRFAPTSAPSSTALSQQCMFDPSFCFVSLSIANIGMALFRTSAVVELTRPGVIPSACQLRVGGPQQTYGWETLREDRAAWQLLISYFSPSYFLALTASANSIRRRIASERVGLSFCCFASFQYLTQRAEAAPPDRSRRWLSTNFFRYYFWLTVLPCLVLPKLFASRWEVGASTGPNQATEVTHGPG